MADTAVSRILAIDPGDKWTGWAGLIWSNHGYVTEAVGTVWTPEFMGRFPVGMSINPPDVVIIEEYRNFPGRGTWSTNDTSQQIGLLKGELQKRRIPYHMQQPALKKPAAGLMRARGVALLRPPAEDGPYIHSWDAQRHAWYWVFQHGSGAINASQITLPRLAG
jgi:hypothetical protein